MKHQQRGKPEGEHSLMEEDQPEEFWIRPTEGQSSNRAASQRLRKKCTNTEKAGAAVEICMLKGTLTTLGIHSALN